MADLQARLQRAVGDAYRIEQELGGGGMSRVFVAVETALDRRIVIKVLPPDLAAELNVERFRREIQLLAKLQHPHIVPLLSAGAMDGLLYYTMPFIEGESLRARLARQGELPIGEAVHILRDVADALVHAHEHGVIHRDIKPDNVLIAGRHGVVTDFGVSKALTTAQDDAALTATGVVLGTPAYMAPEQAAGDPASDHRVDIYSFGALGYEIVSGHPPFDGRSRQQLLSAHALEQPIPVTKRRAAVPAALAELLMRCLEKPAADRPQSAAELLQTLEVMSPTSDERSTARRRRSTISRRMLRAAAVIVVGLVALGLFMGYRQYSRHDVTVEDRVIVAPLVNKTGDARFDQVGELAADWVTRGLAETGIVDVAAFSPKRDASGRVLETELAPDALRAQATRLGAGLIVTGALYSEGDSLQFHARITDARNGALLEPIAPSNAAKREPMPGINAISVRIMGALAQLSGSEMRGLASADVPPSYEAFSDFVRGENAFAVGDFQSARSHFERASALDSTYYAPRVRLAYVLVNLDECTRTDSIGRYLNARRSRLPPFQAFSLDRVLAWCLGDTHLAYVAATQMLRVAPHSSFAQYAVARQAYRINRPEEAVERYDSLGWTKVHRPGYYDDLTDALHKLGKHGRELEVARLFVDRNPGSLQPLVPYVRALSALGRVSEVRQIVAGTLAAPPGTVRSPGDVMATASRELRAHGHPAEAREIAEMLVTWLGKRSPGARTDEDMARALMLAERYAEARVSAQRALRTNPASLVALGYEGTSAAAVGDRTAAERASSSLGELQAPYLDGYHRYWQAAIAVRLGQRDHAISLLRDAVQAGAWWTLMDDSQPEFLSLRGYPPYDELIRPKG